MVKPGWGTIPKSFQAFGDHPVASLGLDPGGDHGPELVQSKSIRVDGLQQGFPVKTCHRLLQLTISLDLRNETLQNGRAFNQKVVVEIFKGADVIFVRMSQYDSG